MFFWTELENEYFWIIFELGKEGFYIFDEDMTQRIYEICLGILAMTEI